MPNSKPRGRQAPDRDPLAKLEAMYTKVGALLHCADQQGTEITRGAQVHHDYANGMAQTLGKRIEKSFPNVDPLDEKLWRKHVGDRAKLAGTIHREHRRAYDTDHEAPFS